MVKNFDKPACVTAYRVSLTCNTQNKQQLAKMTPWTRLLEDQHAWAHPKDGFNLILREGATDAELDDLDAHMGFQFPPEFRELYRSHNGVGTTHTSDPDMISWHFAPASSIAEITSVARDWFQETHPELAARFFPFFDWGCGDYDGYLLAPNRTLMAGIYSFQHEEYQFDESQPPEDFMITVYSSIAESLMAR